MANLRQVREKLGVSRRKLANLTGIDYVALYRVEKGDMKFYGGWKKRVAQALGVSETELE